MWFLRLKIMGVYRYAINKGEKCARCGWEYNKNDEVEVIQPKIGFTLTMHASCFMKAVNEGNINI
jgi:hypothetical protein